MRRTASIRPAFTVIELAIAAVVVAILTVAAWPDREADDQAKLDSASNRFESDIEYARSVALTSPSDPSVIKVNLDDDRYWIAKYSAPDVPITNPATKRPYIVQLGQSGDASLRGVNISADNFGDQHTLVFNSNGGVKANSSVGMEFQLGRKKASVKVSPSAASTQRVNSDLASIGVSNVVTEPARTAEGDDDDGGLIGGLLGGLGL